MTANFAICCVLGIAPLANALTVNFEGTSGFAYDVERSTNLSSWVGVAMNNIAPSGGLINYVEDPATNAEAFYRLKLR